MRSRHIILFNSQYQKCSKIDKRVKDKLVRSPRENGGGKKKKKDLHSRTGRDEKKGKTEERMERGSRKRSSSAGSEKVERVGGRKEKKKWEGIVRQAKGHSGL
jgi:hypothetical protein